MAEKLSVEIKTYQRWERNEHPAKKDNLINISEHTGIPMKALIPLNFGQYIYYSLNKRRVAFDKLETQTSVHKLLLNPDGIPVDEGVTLRFETLNDRKYIQSIIEYDSSLFPSRKTLKRQTLLKASGVLPELNCIVLDQWGHHIGHVTCIPLSDEVFDRFRSRNIFEHQFHPEHVKHPLKLDKGILYFWSFYGASSFVIYNILYKTNSYLSALNTNHALSIANYSMSLEGHELCKKLGMKIIFEDKEMFRQLKTETIPTLFEIPYQTLRKNLETNKQLTQKLINT